MLAISPPAATHSENPKQRAFETACRGVLAFTIAVIVWGAFVRATGAGAGCGSHWPLCNGEVIPRSPGIKTLIEFSHRISSGLSLVAVVALMVSAFRIFPKGHRIRFGTTISTIAILLEAAFGAGLVLLELVAHDKSVTRAVSIVIHLMNTCFLTAALTWTCLLAGRQPPLRLLPSSRRDRWSAYFLLGGFILVGIMGAIAALGDTLFQATSLREGLAQDFSPTAHFLQRLRVFHPFLAIGWGTLSIPILTQASWRHVRPAALIGTNLLFGGLNLLLLVPVWAQLIHLLLANLIWITLIQSLALQASQHTVPSGSHERNIFP